MSAENKERLCGDNINDRSVCGQTRLSLQQIHLQNKCINVLILRPESAWRGVAIMAHNGVEWFIKSHFYFFLYFSHGTINIFEEKISSNVTP